MLVHIALIILGVAVIAIFGHACYKANIAKQSISDSIRDACLCSALFGGLFALAGALSHGEARAMLLWIGILGIVGAFIRDWLRLRKDLKFLRTSAERELARNLGRRYRHTR